MGQSPFTYQYFIDRWADALKILGAGNSGGILATGAAYQFSTHKAEILFDLKIAASLYLVGIILFAVAFTVLTILPSQIEAFVLKSDQIYNGFSELLKAFNKEKENARLSIALVLCSIFSLLCFLLATSRAVFIIFNF